MKVHAFRPSSLTILFSAGITFVPAAACDDPTADSASDDQGDDRVDAPRNGCLQTARGLRCYEIRDGLAITEGDIILGRADEIAGQDGEDGATLRAFPDLDSTRAAERWPRGVVPYVVQAGFTASDIAGINAAVAEYAAHGIRLVPRTGEPDYVVFTPVSGGACGSLIGRAGGAQQITLVVGAAETCIVHEIGHALGFEHEQSRADRTRYITLYPANMQANSAPWFAALPGGDLSLPYDVSSVMHYAWNAYSANGQPTITLKDGSVGALNHKSHLSPRDGVALRYWYERKCGAPVGDFNGDGRADIVTQGGYGWTTTPVFFSAAAGGFSYTGATDPSMAPLGSSIFNAPGVQSLLGDFNRDGKTDIVKKGAIGWGTIPIYFSNGNGTFALTNAWDPSGGLFNFTDAQTYSGDFNGDGRTDLLMRGVAGWQSAPIFFSNGDGNFTFTNGLDPLVSLFNTGSAQTFIGDFNGDTRADVLLRGGPGWLSTPVYLSNGDGTFTVVNAPDPSGGIFNVQGVETYIADFNGDGRSDVLLKGVLGWATTPVFFGNANGTFTVTNAPDPAGGLYNLVGPETLIGDFNRDGRADLTMRYKGWATTPVYTSLGNGSFSVTNPADPSGLFNSPLYQAYPGDFNGDGRTDVSLKGGSSSPSTAVLLSQGNGSFAVEWRNDPSSGLFNGVGIPTPCY